MILLKELWIYPIKSLSGISIAKSMVTDRGLEYDRRWMLVDEDGMFMSQRTIKEMCLFDVSMTDQHLEVTHRQQSDDILRIPLEMQDGEDTTVQIWNDECKAKIVSAEIDQWFSEKLHRKCHLVYMLDDYKRTINSTNIANGHTTSFADAYPFLILGEASLRDLNERLKKPILMNRFRPNLVVSTTTPYEEETWDRFMIGEVVFQGVHACLRCNMTTIEQETATTSLEGEPLKTLATYRKDPETHKVFFGMNLVNEHNGVIKVGYGVKVLDTLHPEE